MRKIRIKRAAECAEQLKRSATRKSINVDDDVKFLFQSKLRLVSDLNVNMTASYLTLVADSHFVSYSTAKYGMGSRKLSCEQAEAGSQGPTAGACYPISAGNPEGTGCFGTV